MTIIYEAYDGEIFYSESDCREYEENLQNVINYAKFIRKYCTLRDDCTGCPFAISDGGCKLGEKDNGDGCEIFPANWNI